MEIILKKRDIIITIIVIIGICFFLGGMRDYYNVKTALALETLSGQEIRNGKYVKGIVKEYCGFMVDGMSKDSFNGRSVTFLGFTGELDFYTIKLQDGQYITLMAERRETKRTLENYQNGRGNSTYIEGIITSPVTELNYAWLQRALGRNSKEEVEEKVISQYAIKEHDFSQKGLGMLYGLGCILTAAIIVVSDRIEKIIIEKSDTVSLQSK